MNGTLLPWIRNKVLLIQIDLKGTAIQVCHRAFTDEAPLLVAQTPPLTSSTEDTEGRSAKGPSLKTHFLKEGGALRNRAKIRQFTSSHACSSFLNSIYSLS